MSKTWGTRAAYVGLHKYGFRIGFFDRVALIVGNAGDYWVIGMMYDSDERALMIGVPGLVVAAYV